MFARWGSVRYTAGLLVFFLMTTARAESAVVTFTGSLLTGTPWNLGSLPRDFLLTLNYTENLSGNSTTAMGSFDILEKLSPPESPLSITTDGVITVMNASGPTGNDTFTFTGALPGQSISPANRPVLYSFTFSQPPGTINDNFVSEENVEKLIVGTTTISLVNNQVNIGGVISGVMVNAPEPSTFLALTGIVLAGCGVGFRRRLLARREIDSKSKSREQPGRQS